jgi:hypothetical protein
MSAGLRWCVKAGLSKTKSRSRRDFVYLLPYLKIYKKKTVFVKTRSRGR